MAKDDPQIIELEKPIGAFRITRGSVPSPGTETVSGILGSNPVDINGWYVDSTYIDMSGWTVQDKTVFITNIQWNDIPRFGITEAGQIAGLPSPTGFTFKIATTVPYASLDQLTDDMNDFAWAGQLGSSMNLDAVVFFELMNYEAPAPAALGSGLVSVLREKRIYTGTNAVASNKLYLYRGILASGPVDEQTWQWMDGLFQAQGIAAEEPDLEYIYRLKRNYELAADQI